MINNYLFRFQVHIGESLVATLTYEAGKNPYISDVNLINLINRKRGGSIQLEEVEVYGELVLPSMFIVQSFPVRYHIDIFSDVSHTFTHGPSMITVIVQKL